MFAGLTKILCLLAVVSLSEVSLAKSETLSRLTKSVKRNPRGHKSRIALACMLYTAGRYRQAAQIWKDLPSLKLHNKVQTLQYAMSFYNTGNCQRALRAFNRFYLIRDERLKPTAMFYGGLCYYRLGYYRSALRNLRAAHPLPKKWTKYRRAVLKRLRRYLQSTKSGGSSRLRPESVFYPPDFTRQKTDESTKPTGPYNYYVNPNISYLDQSSRLEFGGFKVTNSSLTTLGSGVTGGLNWTGKGSVAGTVASSLGISQSFSTLQGQTVEYLATEEEADAIFSRTTNTDPVTNRAQNLNFNLEADLPVHKILDYSIGYRYQLILQELQAAQRLLIQQPFTGFDLDAAGVTASLELSQKSTLNVYPETEQQDTIVDFDLSRRFAPLTLSGSGTYIQRTVTDTFKPAFAADELEVEGSAAVAFGESTAGVSITKIQKTPNENFELVNFAVAKPPSQNALDTTIYALEYTYTSLAGLTIGAAGHYASFFSVGSNGGFKGADDETFDIFGDGTETMMQGSITYTPIPFAFGKIQISQWQADYTVTSDAATEETFLTTIPDIIRTTTISIGVNYQF